MRRFELQLSPIYWRWRRRKALLKFAIGKALYHLQVWLKNVKENVQIAFLIVRSVVLPTVLAFLIVGVLFVCRFWPIPQAMLPAWHLSLDNSNPVLFDTNTYVSLLGTLAQIAGVFLGLYFTTISLVLSTSYARVPADVRRLLMREKMSNFYTYATAMLLAISLLLLELHSYGVQVNVGLAYLILLLLSTITIFGFVFLGLRAFRFFDPIALVDLLLPELWQTILSATPQSLGSQDAAFQVFFRRQATESLKTLESVVNVAIKQMDIQGDDLTFLSRKVLTLLQMYVTQKGCIPTQSRWFEQKSEPRDWLTSDYFELSTALSTDTPLFAKEVPDTLWFEKRLFKIVIFILETLKEQQDAYNAAVVLNTIQGTLQHLGKSYAIEEALLFHRSVGEIVWTWIETIDPEEEQNSLFKVPRIVNSKIANYDAAPFALVEYHGVGLASIILGLSACLINFNPERIKSFLNKIDWSKRDTLYHDNYPQEVWRELESLQENIEFEISIEGEPISPAWLQQQIMACGLSSFLGKSLSEIGREIEKFAQKSQLLLKDKHYFAAAAAAQRGLEVCNKMDAHLDTFQECNIRLESLNHQLGESWPKIDWGDLHERTRKSRAEIVDAFTNLIIAFLNKERPALLPDYFGHAYSLLVHETYSEIIEGDVTAFRRHFPIVLQAAWAAHDRVMKEYRDVPNLHYIFAHRTEPIINVLSLSGLALIYSELDDKTFWQTVKECWDAEMTGRPNPQDLCQLIGHATKDRFMKGQGAWNILRVSWKQALENRLREQGFLDRYYDPDIRGLPPAPKHSSEFIQRLTRHGFGMLFSEPEDIFIAYYLAKRPEAVSVSWSREVDSLLENWQEVDAPDDLERHEEE